MRIGIDIGGTFTDCVVTDQATGRLLHAKALTNAERPLEGVVNVLALLGVDAAEAELFVHGTTIVTNIVVERNGSTVGLITTRGFGDVLEIQRSYRPALFDLAWSKSEPLVPRDLRIELEERTSADGTVIRTPERHDVLVAAERLLAAGVEALAICFLNGYRNPTTEQLVARWIVEVHPDVPVSISSDVDPQIREYERTSTTVANAYAIPPIRAYIRELRERVRPDVLFMHSGGGVLPAAVVAELPVRLVQSGPAGGVVAARLLGRELGVENAVTFDMGGTSTDISVIARGEVSRADDTEIAPGIPVRAESLEILSIGAGGGSIATVDAGGGLDVGPRSAGALPGPVCYGRGGVEPTVSDANLLLGILQPDAFLGGAMALDEEGAMDALARLGSSIGGSSLAAARAIHAVVNANMAQLIREATINRGLDPRDFVLVSFGGAGGQHAYGVAEIVGCREVLFPRQASTFSALGLSGAPLETTRVQSLAHGGHEPPWTQVLEVWEQLEERARKELGAPDSATYSCSRRALTRYSGQSHELVVNGDDCTRDKLYERFEDEHERVCGTRLGDPMEIVSVLATVRAEHGSALRIFGRSKSETNGRRVAPVRRRVELFEAEADVYHGGDLPIDVQIAGPALVLEDDTVLVVPEGASLTNESGDAFRMRLRGD
jgi:N-methylhydantoinase A